MQRSTTLATLLLIMLWFSMEKDESPPLDTILSHISHKANLSDDPSKEKELSEQDLENEDQRLLDLVRQRFADQKNGDSSIQPAHRKAASQPEQRIHFQDYRKTIVHHMKSQVNQLKKFPAGSVQHLEAERMEAWLIDVQKDPPH